MSKSVNQLSVPHMLGRRSDNRIEKRHISKKRRQYKDVLDSLIDTKLMYKLYPFERRIWKQIPDDKYKKNNETKTIHTQRRKEAKFKNKIQTTGHGGF